MSFSTNTKLLISFEDALPFDKVSNVSFDVYGTYATTTGKFGNALQMAGNTYYDIDALTSLTNQFTIAFLLKSVNPGIITNPTTHTTQPLKMALFSKSIQSYSSVTNLTTLTSEMFSVWEETQSDGTNVLKIRVKGATTATLTTPAYSTGVFHNFWIVYGSSTLKVYIDGTLSSSTISGTVPATLTASSARFSINKGIDGSGYETARNGGVLDDLLILSTANNTKSDIFQAIDLGVFYVADTSLINEDEVSFGTVFDDTSTIQINSVFGNRGNVYVGRSDGLLLKGARILWESRRDFSNPEESKYLSIITKSTSSNYVVQDGIMTVTNAIIRV